MMNHVIQVRISFNHDNYLILATITSLLSYMVYHELLKLSMQNLENRRNIYNSIQKNSKNITREQMIIADTYYRNAQNTLKKAQAEYNLSRVILENLAGKEALSEIEKNK